MGNIFKNLKGTTSSTFTVGKPSSPDQVIGLIAWDKYDTQMDISDTSYNVYREVSFYLPKGTYRIAYLYYWNYSNVTDDIRIQCRFDGTEVSFQRQEPKDGGSNQRYLHTTFDYVTVDTDGDYTMQIRFRCRSTSHIASMFRSVMEIWRVL